jgi:hypothetical protein
MVIGMHRSGTSALTGALHRLGVAVGSDISEAPDGNVAGYYEHQGILAIQEDLLAACGSSWDDVAPRPWPEAGHSEAITSFQSSLSALLAAEFADAPLWAVKDPRLCRTLPLWLPVLDQLQVRPHVILAHRPLGEVAASLARRNEFSFDKSALLWIGHVLESERASRGLPRAFVGFSDLLADPVATLQRVGSQLAIEWPHSPAARAAELGPFLNVGLRHNRGQVRGFSGRHSELAEQLEAALALAAEAPSSTTSFDALAARHAATQPSIDPVLIEHLHQFSRRETAASLWTVKEGLEGNLEGASERLGAGIAKLETTVAELRASQDELASALDAASRLAEERSAAIDRSLKQLSQAGASLQSATGYQEGQLADLRARLDRLQHELQLESRLMSTQAALDYLRNRVDAIAARSEENWMLRLARRLRFWRASPPPLR